MNEDFFMDDATSRNVRDLEGRQQMIRQLEDGGVSLLNPDDVTIPSDDPEWNEMMFFVTIHFVMKNPVHRFIHTLLPLEWGVFPQRYDTLIVNLLTLPWYAPPSIPDFEELLLKSQWIPILIKKMVDYPSVGWQKQWLRLRNKWMFIIEPRTSSPYVYNSGNYLCTPGRELVVVDHREQVVRRYQPLPLSALWRRMDYNTQHRSMTTRLTGIPPEQGHLCFAIIDFEKQSEFVNDAFGLYLLQTHLQHMERGRVQSNSPLSTWMFRLDMSIFRSCIRPFLVNPGQPLVKDLLL
jgi:hypothetical protein